MEGLIKDSAIFQEVLAMHLPDLASHLAYYKVDVLMYMTPWFLSMYTQLPNWELVLSIYDTVLVEGYSLSLSPLCPSHSSPERQASFASLWPSWRGALRNL